MKKVLVIKNKYLSLYRDKEITQRTGPVPGNSKWNDNENENAALPVGSRNEI